MDYRLGSHNSGTWQLAPDSLGRTQSSAHQLCLQLRAPSLCERVEKPTVPPSPGEKRDLVDWRNESRTVFGFPLPQPRKLPCQVSERLDPRRLKNVEVIRPAKMDQIPNHLHLCIIGRGNDRSHGSKIVTAG